MVVWVEREVIKFTVNMQLSQKCNCHQDAISFADNWYGS